MRVGILGTGHMGNTHARHYRKMPEVKVGYHDRHPERGESFRERWDAECCKSSEELIAWADVIDICLPTDLHVEYSLKAIAAGKAVFLEKPIARTMEDGLTIVNAAESAGVPLMVGQVLRFFPDYRKARELVLSGAIGKPAAARMRRGGPAPSGLNYWFQDLERSGGVLLDLVIHDFDWLRWTLGEVKHVYARSLAATRHTGTDYALTTLTFENGCVAHVEGTWMDPGGFRTTFEVAGSEGLIEFDSRTTPPLRVCKQGSSFNDASHAAELDPYYLELKGFLDAVSSGAKPPVTGEDALRALAISLAAIESSKTDRLVQPIQP
ncbi:MAG TPA: Gfo/Idh/MocA family oxidoreductase [Fimbriimonas sp.]|nr:Gfo/Idh/MocA family oxidoreductase [Fimbriimonas sp.]